MTFLLYVDRKFFYKTIGIRHSKLKNKARGLLVEVH